MKIPFLMMFTGVLLAGCQDRMASSPQAESATQAEPAAFNMAGAPTMMLSIPNMHCESCVAKTTEVLSKQPGVVDVRVDLDTLRAKVAIDPTTFDGATALAALDDYGFAGSSIVNEGFPWGR